MKQIQVNNHYIERMNDPSWAKLRARKLKQQNFCESCGTVESIEIHHKTYKNLWNEKLNELAALCIYCHRMADEERKRPVGNPSKDEKTLREEFLVLHNEGYKFSSRLYNLPRLAEFMSESGGVLDMKPTELSFQRYKMYRTIMDDANRQRPGNGNWTDRIQW